MDFFRGQSPFLWLAAALLLSILVGTAGAQGLPSLAGRGSFPLGSQLSRPSNPLGAPGSAYGSVGSDFVPLSSGMLRGILPRIPNLELGFLYNIGGNVRSGRFYADYLYPFKVSGDSVLFGEAHYESQDFWKKPAGGSDYRQDLSLGGGFRRIFLDRSFLGVNAFYDGTKLFGKWYSSAGLGLEMAAITPGEGAIDLNVNWYGNLINESQLINAFRNQAGSWDVEAGVSQPLFDQAFDLRLKAVGYNFNIGEAVYGWKAGAELTTRNGVFTVKYEHGQDRINGSYDTIGGYVNVGVQLERIASGESPFMMPTPVFASPRNLGRKLTQKVKRNWHQPIAAVFARQSSGCNTERFLAAVPTPLYSPIPDFWRIYQTVGSDPAIPAVPFPAVPYTCLDPAKNIVVEFDYEFGGGPPTFGLWTVEVGDASYTYNNVESTMISAGVNQGHLVIPLTHGGWPTVDQSAFTTTATDPALLFIAAYTQTSDGVTSLTVTNVAIHFNQ